MISLLPYFYQIILLEYSLLFFIVIITQRIRFVRLLYISSRETVLLTVVMIATFIGIRYSQYKTSLVTSTQILDFLLHMVVGLGYYYLMFILLFYATSISFNMIRQASSFWAIMNWKERISLVLIPLCLLALNLLICYQMTNTFYKR